MSGGIKKQKHALNRVVRGSVSDDCEHRKLIDLLLPLDDRVKVFECSKCKKKFTWKQMIKLL